MSDPKADAFEFLEGLGKAILKSAPRAVDMDPEIRRIVAAAKADAREKHRRLPESTFRNTFVLPVLHRYLQDGPGLTAEQAREALLHEYHRTMPEISRRSPIRA